MFFKNGPIPASFCFIFVLFSLQFQYKLKKSIDGVLGIRTQGRRMVGSDKTTELWRPPLDLDVSAQNKNLINGQTLK